MSSDEAVTAGTETTSSSPAVSSTRDVAATSSPGQGDEAPPTNPKRTSWRQRVEIAGFLLPATLIYTVFVLAPIALAAYYSGYDWNGIEELTNFIGLQNYRDALGDPVFRMALWHNGFIVIGSILVQLPLALGLALLLNRRLPGRSVFRMIFFVPYVLSEVIAAVAWQLILPPDGLVDRMIEGLGLGGAVQLWLANPDIVLWTVLVVVSWKYVGFAIILFIAGLQGIPEDLTEAAAIDGASWWQTQRRITIPLLGPTIRIWVFLSMIGSLQLFDMVWIMTGGGPANASNTMATYMISRGFERSQFGYGSAVAVILFLISFVAAVTYQRVVLARDVDGAVTRQAG